MERDLDKLREEDKLKPKPKLTEEDLKIIKEQEETGKKMEELLKRERFLVRNKKKIMSDDSFMLYRLPITDEQMKEIYEDIIKNNLTQ